MAALAPAVGASGSTHDVGAPPPGRSWHVSPLVDTLAYHFSWVFALVPMVLLGPDRRSDYFVVYVVVIVVSFTHRWLSFPYVYLDREVFEQHAYRFVLVPALLLVGFGVTVAQYDWRIPAHTFSAVTLAACVAAAIVLVQLRAGLARGHRFRPLVHGLALVPLLLAACVQWQAADLLCFPSASSWLWLLALTATATVHGADASRTTRRPAATWLAPAVLAAVSLMLFVSEGGGGVWPERPLRFRRLVWAVFFAGAVWNVWHTLMQKYGIMRLYEVKRAKPGVGVPAWADRLLVLSPLPLVVHSIALGSEQVVATAVPGLARYLLPIVEVVQTHQALILPAAVLLPILAAANFARFEWRTAGSPHWPRVSMALGTLAGLLVFAVFDPIKAYIAFGFGHAIEYTVFVWAFARRRYARPLAHRPLLGRILRRPLLAYAIFFACLSGGYLWVDFSDELFLGEPQRLFGATLGRWAFWITVWSQLAHFYFDGFLWKMRLPSVRESL